MFWKKRATFITFIMNYKILKQLLEEKYPLLKRELKPCFTVDAFADKLQRLCPIEYAAIMSDLTEKRMKWWIESYYLSRHTFIKRRPFKKGALQNTIWEFKY